MVYLECDYNNGCHPAVLEKLTQTNDAPQLGYGFDEYSESAKQKIKAACGRPEADVFFLVGGTQTNATVLSSILKPHEGVVAVDSGHIGGHECGAVEYTGHKVLTVPGENGKLPAPVLKNYLSAFYGDANFDHMVFPGAVYISFPTELGTLYSRQELQSLHEVCKEYSIPLYVDGARLGYGLSSYACDFTLQDLCGLCDIFYIGGTKVGALCGEAVVFPNGDAPAHFFSMIKQHGALLAKGRLAGVQFDALFTDGLYFAISRHAIEMAEKLKQIIRDCHIDFWLETPTNQQFIILDDAFVKRLDPFVANGFWEKYDETRTVVRFCTSWATTDEQLNDLAKYLKTV